MTKRDLSDIFGINIEKERVKLGYSQSQMANALDMSLSSYKRVINGETMKINLYAIYRMYYLTNRLVFELCGGSDPYLDISHRLRDLNSHQLRFINAVIDFEIDFAKELKPGQDGNDFITILVPTGDMEDGMIYNSCAMEKADISPYRKRYGDSFDCGIRITTNHLHPVYHRGDTILISKRSIRNREVGIFINCETGVAYLRTFLQTEPCQLVPVNGLGKTFYIDSGNVQEMNKWTLFGVVITKMRT